MFRKSSASNARAAIFNAWAPNFQHYVNKIEAEAKDGFLIKNGP